MTTTTIDRVILKYSCGLCACGRHDLCPGAVFSPGAGKVLTPGSGSTPPVYEGIVQWCPCQSAEHDGEPTAKCRDCGQRATADQLTPRLTCLDAADCALRVSARLENDPLHQLILECQTTRVVAGEVTERPRRATPEQREQRRAEKKAAVARPCTCGCEGTTKGGAFLPGHDARFVARFAQRWVEAGGDNRKACLLVIKEAREALAPFPALLAKFEKRLG